MVSLLGTVIMILGIRAAFGHLDPCPKGPSTEMESIFPKSLLRFLVYLKIIIPVPFF